MNEKFKEILKNYQTENVNLKNAFQRFNQRLDQMEEIISEYEDRSLKI
jgi:hypothetical protein